jgi:signal recognition particle GTPase
MVLGGIAEKMTGIVEFISGQSTITESNIEDTLKEVKGILIDADVNLQVTNTLISKVRLISFHYLTRNNFLWIR